jgi:ribose transport system permease protein
MKALRQILSADWAGLVGILLLGCVVGAIFSPAFMTEYNIYVILRSACVAVLVAFSQMIMLGVGQMNLSVGALGGLVAVLFGAMLELLGLPLPLAALIALLAGMLGGVLNGLLTARTGISGFIITLATGSAFTGINLGLTESRPFHRIPPEFVALGDGHWGLLPTLFWLPFLVTMGLWLFLYRLRLGRHLLAVGGNLHAAELSGISSQAMIILAYSISGGLAGLAGLLAVAQLGAAQPQIGANWLLISFAGPIIGGTSLAGGHVSIPGTIIAVLIIALIQNAMVLFNVDPYWVQFMLGTLVLLTVGLDRWRVIRLGRQ